MLKALLVIIVLFLACGYAIVLLRQLNSTAQQLGKLRQDLAKSDAKVNDKLQEIEERQLEERKREKSSTRNGADTPL